MCLAALYVYLVVHKVLIVREKLAFVDKNNIIAKKHCDVIQNFIGKK